MNGGEDEVSVAVFDEVGMGFAVARAVVVGGLAVELNLVIASWAPAADEVPVGFAGERVGGAVEFVGPDEVPGLGVDGCEGNECEGQSKETREHSCQDSCHRDDGIRTD